LGFSQNPQKPQKPSFLSKTPKTPILAILAKNAVFAKNPKNGVFQTPQKSVIFPSLLIYQIKNECALAYVQKGNIYQIEKRCFFSIFFRFF